MKTRPNNNKIRWSIETKYSRMNQVKFSWKPAFKNFEVIRSAKTDHIISDVKILFKFSFFQFLSSDQ